MRRRLNVVVAAAGFTREALRVPTTVTLLLILPWFFVLAASTVLTPFAEALGGTVAGRAATALGAGWAAAFLAGAFGYFQTTSSRDADRRLARAGFGALAVAGARLGAAVTVCTVVTVVALVALAVVQPVPHTVHAAVAVFTYALVYLGIGTVIGVLVHDELAGSLAVVLVFLLDVFSGPGMASNPSGWERLLTPSRAAGELLIDAGMSRALTVSDLGSAAGVAAAALVVALAVFWVAARGRR